MEKIVVELQAKTDKALKGIDSVSKSVKDLNKSVVKGNKETADSLKSVEKSSNLVSKGVKGIGTALKAAGIGLALGLLSQLKEIFEKNQKVADLFSASFETVSILFNDFANFVINSTGSINNFFKSIFENPRKSLSEFADAFKRNIQERFDSYLDTLGYLASAVKKVFSGDFAGALDDVKSAGKESLDVLTGVNNSFDKSTDAVNKVVKATSEYVKETVKAAKSNVELEKTARIAETANQGLIEKFDRQAEQLRQIRDDESKSFDERLKANQELGLLLNKQEKAMLSNAQARVNQASAELSKNKENVDLQIAYQEALNEQAGIEAQITGFRSEQQTNANSLLKEQKDLQNELALIGKTERDLERLEAQQDYDAKKLLIEREITDESEKKRLLEELEKQHKSNLKTIDDEEAVEKKEKEDKKKEDDEKKYNDLVDTYKKERELDKQKIRDKAMVVDAISQFADAESGIGKALLIVKQGLALQETIMDLKRITFKGIEAVGSAGVATAQNVAESSKIGFPQNLITIASAIAQGVGIVKSVKSAVSKTKAKAGGAGASVPSIATPSMPSLPPAFNVVGASDTSQLADAIGSQSQQPTRAYVVSADVTTSQEMDRNTIEGASI